ncbi:MAG: hypothetical protein U1E69_16015 [Tabrizicola sp.]|uniref:hypothetical protein n=1 Tax=Tabrizicola sp. TaxID=2005166 RepID=UPI002ABB6EAC|nr:hypothetical protein [Tabrizicola sp.]MDZ4088294.1 hypothetical protein [Tabrizicola sp.]
MQENLNVRIRDLISGEAMRLAFLPCLTVCSASLAAADGSALRPESCSRLATAQYDDCSVANVFRCADGAPAFWIESRDAYGLTVETRNLNHGSVMWDLVGQGMVVRLDQSKAHPRDTIQNGRAEDRIVGELELFGRTQPISGETSYGYFGETTVLAGETFARITFSGVIRMPPPVPDIDGGGLFLYSDRLDLLLEEEVRVDLETGSSVYRLTRLALSGQAGFGDETPRDGCGEISGLSLPGSEVTG